MLEKNIILESIGDAFFAVDENWIVSYWNSVAESILNVSKQQIAGSYLWDVFSESIGSESYKKYHQAVDTNQAVHFEDYYPALQKWYDISAFPSSNGLSVYIKEITERKKITSALEESERNYSLLFQLSPLPKWVFGVQTLAFLDVNQAATENYGYSKEQFLKMTVKDIIPSDDLPYLQEILSDNSLIPERIYHGMSRHITRKGKVIQVDVHSNLIQFKGKPAKIITAHDMTERQNYIKAIEEQNTKLQEIAFMQSHVVRAPLARIKGIASMLQDWETFADEREKLLDFLLIAANELDDVIKETSVKIRYVEDT